MKYGHREHELTREGSMKFSDIYIEIVTNKILLTIFCYADIRGKRGFSLKNLSSAFIWGEQGEESKLYIQKLLNMKVITKKGSNYFLNELGQCVMTELESFTSKKVSLIDIKL